MTSTAATTATAGADRAAPDDCIAPGVCIDSDHPDVKAFTARHTRAGQSPVEMAVALYYAVRDEFIYDPYGVDLTDRGMSASAVLERGAGFCITKAALLAACCRAAGIPSRLGFADVRNHLSTKKLIEKIGNDLFVFHGYTELFLEGKWVKATPAFNLSLCEKFGVLPLEFDGRTDSVLQPYDASGRRHMEYVADRGVRSDVPVQEIRDAFAEAYPKWTPGHPDKDGAQAFTREAEAESSRTA